MSLFDDEARKPKGAGHEIGSDLSLLSADELEHRIGLLQAEIERLQAEKTRKQASRSAAEGLFR